MDLVITLLCQAMHGQGLFLKQIFVSVKKKKKKFVQELQMLHCPAVWASPAMGTCI